jgi:hypothetical protein
MAQKICKECRWFEDLEKEDKWSRCRYNPEPAYVEDNDWCSHWETKRDGAGDTERIIAEAREKEMTQRVLKGLLDRIRNAPSFLDIKPGKRRETFAHLSDNCIGGTEEAFTAAHVMSVRHRTGIGQTLGGI